MFHFTLPLFKIGLCFPDPCYFHSNLLLEAIYCALVHSVIKYGCVIWDSPLLDWWLKLMIEKVQRRFLRAVAFRFNISHPPHDYSSIQNLLQLSNLADRRRVYYLFFLSNISNSKAGFQFPTHHKSLSKFPPPFHPISCLFSPANFLNNSPILRLMRIKYHDFSFEIRYL